MPKNRTSDYGPGVVTTEVEAPDDGIDILARGKGLT